MECLSPQMQHITIGGNGSLYPWANAAGLKFKCSTEFTIVLGILGYAIEAPLDVCVIKICVIWIRVM